MFDDTLLVSIVFSAACVLATVLLLSNHKRTNERVLAEMLAKLVDTNAGFAAETIGLLEPHRKALRNIGYILNQKGLPDNIFDRVQNLENRPAQGGIADIADLKTGHQKLEERVSALERAIIGSLGDDLHPSRGSKP